jgi:hypothetical protein
MYFSDYANGGSTDKKRRKKSESRGQRIASMKMSSLTRLSTSKIEKSFPSVDILLKMSWSGIRMSKEPSQWAISSLKMGGRIWYVCLEDKALITDLCRSGKCFKVDQDSSGGVMDWISAHKISSLDVEKYLFVAIHGVCCLSVPVSIHN